MENPIAIRSAVKKSRIIISAAIHNQVDQDSEAVGEPLAFLQAVRRLRDRHWHFGKADPRAAHLRDELGCVRHLVLHEVHSPRSRGSHHSHAVVGIGQLYAGGELPSTTAALSTHRRGKGMFSVRPKRLPSTTSMSR